MGAYLRYRRRVAVFLKKAERRFNRWVDIHCVGRPLSGVVAGLAKRPDRAGKPDSAVGCVCDRTKPAEHEMAAYSRSIVGAGDPRIELGNRQRRARQSKLGN